MTLMQIILNNIRRSLYFVDLTTFYTLGQKFVKFFVGFLENLRLSKRHSEINWPLASDESVFNNVFLAMSALKSRLYSTGYNTDAFNT